VTVLTRWAVLAAQALVILAAIVALTLVFERVMPPQFASLLAAIVVALVAVRLIKRRPPHRALFMLRIYLGARARGADEAAAREQLLARLVRDVEVRRRVGGHVQAAWAGPGEKERVVAGVRVLLAREAKALPPADIGRLYDRARDRFTIPGWESLPHEFVEAVRRPLDERERAQLDALIARYQLFRQRFFRSPSSLASDPPASVMDLARLLQSLGNRLTGDAPGDSERAYRLSLRLRPELNLSHAGLAVLLERTGRVREAEHEARVALDVLDRYARRGTEGEATVEDISPFRSPLQLRAELERILGARATP
jgi:hypothetical protein